MAYLVNLLWPGLMLALMFGVIAGWALHAWRGRNRLAGLKAERERLMARLRDRPAPASATAAPRDDSVLYQSRLAAAEAELANLRSTAVEAVGLRARLAELQRAAASGEPPARNWRLKYFEARTRVLEERLAAAGPRGIDPARHAALERELAELKGKLAAAGPPAPTVEEDELTRLVWRNRYLDARVKRLEAGALVAAAPVDAEAERRAYWRARYFAARAKHLEPIAAQVPRLTLDRDRAQAALREMEGFEAHERERADHAERALARALGQPIAMLQRDFRQAGRFWTNSPTGAPAAVPAPAGWAFPTLADGARVAQHAGGFKELRPREVLRLEAGRVYRITARVRQIRDATNGGGQHAGIDLFPPLDDAFNALPAERSPAIAPLEGFQRAAAPRAGGGWVELGCLVKPTQASAPLIRPRVYVNWAGPNGGEHGNGAAQIASFAIDDITDVGAAEAAAREAEQREEEAARRARWRARYMEARVARLETLKLEADAASQALIAERAAAVETAAQALRVGRAEIEDLNARVGDAEMRAAAAEARAQALAKELDATADLAARARAELEALQRAQRAVPAPLPLIPPAPANAPEPSQAEPPQVAHPLPVTAPTLSLAPRAPARLPGPRGGIPDDLRLIPGITPQLERTLNSLGVFHFDQIAQWTGEHVAWVDRFLSLKGRIQRERWVDGAAALSPRPTARRAVDGDAA